MKGPGTWPRYVESPWPFNKGPVTLSFLGNDVIFQIPISFKSTRSSNREVGIRVPFMLYREARIRVPFFQ